jgi:hypothetical protein
MQNTIYYIQSLIYCFFMKIYTIIINSNITSIFIVIDNCFNVLLVIVLPWKILKMNTSRY